jgi:phosphate transport system protein
MSEKSFHIVKSYDAELENLRALTVEMGVRVEEQLENSFEAFRDNNVMLSESVIAHDEDIDHIEYKLVKKSIRMIALRQPFGDDLRNIIAVQRIANDLERIGDYAENIAKRVIASDNQSNLISKDILREISKLHELVLHSFRDIMQAYQDHDLEKARQIWRFDQDINDQYTIVFKGLLKLMTEQPEKLTYFTHLHFLIKNYERTGDRITNIAETIYFIVTGKMPKKKELEK